MELSQMYIMYRDQSSMPGECTRTLTREFVKLKASGKYSDEELCKNLLTIRFDMYKSMGMKINDALPKSILEIANGYFPFVIFADTLVVNHNNVVHNLEAVLNTFDIILQVIMDEYNKIVFTSEKIVDITLLKTKSIKLIKEQTGRNV